MTYPNPTAVYHNNPAPIIDPTQKHLSVAGKTILVTGGGTAIGAATVEAFAKAKADHIFFVGRRLNLLLEVEKRLSKAYPQTKFHPLQTDISKEDEVKALIQTINKVSFLDVLVANAAYLPTPGAIATSDTSEWWKGYEINVLGTFLLGKYFISQSQPLRGKPAFIGVNTGAINIPPRVVGPISGYVSSKMATASVVEFLQAENPSIKAFNVSPGTVQSEMSVKANTTEFPPTDSPELMANFAVWLASPESDFLAGRFLWANWDVEGLITAKDKISANPGQLQLALEGWWSNFAALK